uniref:DUF6771 family protein n=1 Tax=Sphingomonas sp. PL-96 TaxID=2887201 RepID=UPI001E3DC8D3|nr:DUF6771 family protein [Sphingomonas sp. PL-96]
MEPADPAAIATAILEAPGWCRVGITAPGEHLRKQAAKELALSIASSLDAQAAPDRNQLLLPL